MKILFITPSYKPAFTYGGTITAISKLAEGLVKAGHEISIYTTTANGNCELEVETQKEIKINGVRVFYFDRITKDHTHISPTLWKFLYKTINEFDVIHLHSWWNPLIIGCALICKQKHINYFLSPHGMYCEYVLKKRNALKKKLIHNLIGKNVLKNARILATSEMEWRESKQLIPHCTGTIISNLVELPKKEYLRKKNEKFTIGFLSRIHDKKGLDILIRSLSEVNFPFELQVAGDGEKRYIQYLQDLADNCGIANNIKWLGWKNGDEKFEFLSQIDLFALTSHNENFAVVVIEALSVGTPVLISEYVGLSDFVREFNLGWITRLYQDEITKNLNQAFADSNKRKTIEKIGESKIREAFNETKLAEKYINFYRSIISENAEINVRPYFNAKNEI